MASSIAIDSPRQLSEGKLKKLEEFGYIPKEKRNVPTFVEKLKEMGIEGKEAVKNYVRTVAMPAEGMRPAQSMHPSQNIQQEMQRKQTAQANSRPQNNNRDISALNKSIAKTEAMKKLSPAMKTGTSRNVNTQSQAQHQRMEQKMNISPIRK